MKVGDYVRTKWRITKITSLNTYCNLVVETESGDIDKDKIIKSSPNIIDLIEVGDYVNGELIIALRKDINSERSIHMNSKDNLIFTDYDIANNWYYGIDTEDIKSIVTKEQFSQMEYRIGR